MDAAGWEKKIEDVWWESHYEHTEGFHSFGVRLDRRIRLRCEFPAEPKNIYQLIKFSHENQKVACEKKYTPERSHGSSKPQATQLDLQSLKENQKQIKRKPNSQPTFEGQEDPGGALRFAVQTQRQDRQSQENLDWPRTAQQHGASVEVRKTQLQRPLAKENT